MEQIKKKNFVAQVLVLVDLQQPFEIETDASDYSLDAVITQLDPLVVFHYDTFSDIVRMYSTYEK